MKFSQYAGLLSAAFLGGFVAVAAFGSNQEVTAQDKKEASKGKVVKANEFVLTSKDGKTRAKLALNAKGVPNLTLFSKYGKGFKQFKDVDRLDLSAEDYEAMLKTLRSDIKRVADLEEHKDAEITVSHILISFSGTRTSATRSKEEAEKLAADVFDRLKNGDADFDELRKTFSDDPGPGTYTMVNNPGPEGAGAGKYDRKGMVAAFGNVGWKLKVDEIGVAGFEAKESPFGWHIIKRVK